jgi:hypothetical protein
MVQRAATNTVAGVKYIAHRVFTALFNGLTIPFETACPDT